MEYFPNINLCDEGCDLIGINITTMTVICEYYFSETEREENLKDKVLEQAQIGFIEDRINKSIFIILFLIFIEIICTIIYCISSKKSIDKYILNIANNYIDYLNLKLIIKIKTKKKH